MTIGMTTFGGDGGKSGISQYIINLLRQFSLGDGSDQFEVMVYRNEQDLFIPNSDRLRPLCFGSGIRRPLVNLAWHQVMLPTLCEKRHYDVLFLPAANRRVPLFAPCPTIGTVHDFSSIHVPGKYDPARMLYITKVLPFLVRRLTQVITVSESSKRDILDYAKVPEDRVTVIPLAADTECYYPQDPVAAHAQIGPKYGIDRPYLLYLSRIEHPGKNHVRLINAFGLLKGRTGLPHQLVLAGSDWGRAEEVHLAAHQSAFAHDIVFTGFVATSDIPFLYNGADAFIFPSLYEGFGLPILEAMSCGLPVACSNVSSLPEVAGDAGILFDPYDEEAICDALFQLLTDDAARANNARLGLERSHQFGWDITARRTLEIIHKLR